MEKLTVIKVGGKIVEEEATLQRLLDDFASIEGKKILVHGGGRSATRIAEKMGVPTVMVDGRRVTDLAMLDVVTMVYGGLVNKRIVAQLQARGVRSLGVTGADLDLIRSHKREVKEVDYGWVGDVDRADTEMFVTLINSGITPVVAPLTHDGCGNMLNTNADTMAATVAEAVANVFDVTLMFCFEFPGVLADAENPESVIPTINPEEFRELRNSGIVAGGMIPKLENAFKSLQAGVKRVVITRADAIAKPDAGTTIQL